MRFRVAHQHGLSNAHSPFRVVEQTGAEVEWVNRYLDQERVRGVADSTLRAYAHDLLQFLRGVSEVAMAPIGRALLAKHVPREGRGTVMGMYFTTQTLARSGVGP